MSHFQLTLLDKRFDLAREIKQTQEIRYCCSGPTDSFRGFLVGHIELFDQSFQRSRFLKGVQVFTLDIFDLLHRNSGIIRNIPYDRRDFLQACKLCSSPATLAGYDFVVRPAGSRVYSPDDNWLNNALRLD